ncbi:hypothetical protein P9112_002278 [Eukaryota sp. TZLM1-RC]
MDLQQAAHHLISQLGEDGVVDSDEFHRIIDGFNSSGVSQTRISSASSRISSSINIDLSLYPTHLSFDHIVSILETLTDKQQEDLIWWCHSVVQIEQQLVERFERDYLLLTCCCDLLVTLNRGSILVKAESNLLNIIPSSLLSFLIKTVDNLNQSHSSYTTQSVLDEYRSKLTGFLLPGNDNDIDPSVLAGDFRSFCLPICCLILSIEHFNCAKLKELFFTNFDYLLLNSEVIFNDGLEDCTVEFNIILKEILKIFGGEVDEVLICSIEYSGLFDILPTILEYLTNDDVFIELFARNDNHFNSKHDILCNLISFIFTLTIRNCSYCLFIDLFTVITHPLGSDVYFLDFLIQLINDNLTENSVICILSNAEFSKFLLSKFENLLRYSLRKISVSFVLVFVDLLFLTAHLELTLIDKNFDLSTSLDKLEFSTVNLENLLILAGCIVEAHISEQSLVSSSDFEPVLTFFDRLASFEIPRVSQIVGDLIANNSFLLRTVLSLEGNYYEFNIPGKSLICGIVKSEYLNATCHSLLSNQSQAISDLRSILVNQFPSPIIPTYSSMISMSRSTMKGVVFGVLVTLSRSINRLEISDLYLKKLVNSIDILPSISELIDSFHLVVSSLVSQSGSSEVLAMKLTDLVDMLKLFRAKVSQCPILINQLVDKGEMIVNHFDEVDGVNSTSIDSTFYVNALFSQQFSEFFTQFPASSPLQSLSSIQSIINSQDLTPELIVYLLNFLIISPMVVSLDSTSPISDHFPFRLESDFEINSKVSDTEFHEDILISTVRVNEQLTLLLMFCGNRFLLALNKNLQPIEKSTIKDIYCLG